MTTKPLPTEITELAGFTPSELALRFDELIRTYTYQPGVINLEEQFDRLNREMADAIGQCSSNDYENAARLLIKRYTAGQLSARFPMIRSELFELRRWIKVEFMPTPVIAADQLQRPEGELSTKPERSWNTKPSKAAKSAKSDEPAPSIFEWINLPFLTPRIWSDTVHYLSVGHQKLVFEREYNVPSGGSYILSAELPALPSFDRQRLLVGEFLAIWHGARADIYRHASACRAMNVDQSSGRQGMIDVELNIYWVPREFSLNYNPVSLDRDPILVAKHAGCYYLLDQWDTPGEQPLEDLLREFSI